MSKVTFLRDFRGRATAEAYYVKGQVVDLPEWQVAACLAEGVVQVEQAAAGLVTPPPVEIGAAVQPPSAAPVVRPRRGRKPKVTDVVDE